MSPASLHDRYHRFLLWADRRPDNLPLLQLSMHRLVRLLLITAREFQRNALGVRAGAITYAVLLSLVPILAMSTALVKGFGGEDHLREAAYRYLESLEGGPAGSLPGDTPAGPETSSIASAADADLTEHLRTAVDQLFDYVERTDFAAVGTFGLTGLLLSVMLVLGNIEAAMNTIWRVSTGRSLARKVADYLTLLILMPLSINVTFAASAMLQNPNLALLVDALIPPAWLQTLLLKALPVVVTAFTLYVIYIFFPNTRVKTRPAMLGAILAAVLWFAIQNLYISLQIGVAGYNAIYGSFATVVLFLVWNFLGWLFILLGAQVAFAAQTLHEHHLVPRTVKPSLQLAAAFDIMYCLYRFFSHNRRLTADLLIASLPGYPPQLVRETVSLLRSTGMVHVSRSDDRLLPAAPPDQYRPEEIVGVVFGLDLPDSPGGTMSSTAMEAARKACETMGAEKPAHP